MSQDGTTPPEVNNQSLFVSGANSLRNAQRGQDSGLFSVSRYPSDVGKNDNPHYVMFYITKRTADIGNSENSTPLNVNFDISNANRALLGDAAQRAAALIAGAVGGAEVGGKVVDTAKNLAGVNENLGVLETGARIATAGIGAGVVGTSRFAEGAERSLLKKAIALYVNGAPSSQYTATWENKSIGILGGTPELLGNLSGVASGAVSAGSEAINGNLSGAMDSLKSMGNSALGAIGSLGAGAAALAINNTTEDFAGLGNAQALVQSSAGATTNPFETQLFKNMGFRTFGFNYKFLPKNQAEYAEVKEIIKTFKKYMHPTLSPDKIIMGYPAEFTIAYYYGEDTNSELFKIGNCALTNLKVTYGTGNDLISFRESNGAPSEINMELQFTELEILTESRIDEGY